MYIFDDMLVLARQEWKTPTHEVIAKKLLLCNPGVFTCQALMDHGAAINQLSEDEAKKLTIEGAVRMGIPFNTGGRGR